MKGRGKMGPRPRLHGGRLFARTTGGCTPILTFPPEGGRERGEGEGRFPRGKGKRGGGRAVRELHPHPNLPPCPYGKRGTEGMTREGGGEREGKDGSPPPSSRGQAIREDTGGCTPILTFPPEGGRERGEGEGRFANRLYGAQEGRVRGGRGVRRG